MALAAPAKLAIYMGHCVYAMSLSTCKIGIEFYQNYH